MKFCCRPSGLQSRLQRHKVSVEDLPPFPPMSCIEKTDKFYVFKAVCAQRGRDLLLLLPPQRRWSEGQDSSATECVTEANESLFS